MCCVSWDEGILHLGVAGRGLRRGCRRCEWRREKEGLAKSAYEKNPVRWSKQLEGCVGVRDDLELLCSEAMFSCSLLM